MAEDVAHSGCVAEVTLIDFSYLNRLALSTFTEVGPNFQIKIPRLEPVIEKAKKLSTLQYPRSISVTSVVSINKGQPCLTSSDRVVLCCALRMGFGGPTILVVSVMLVSKVTVRAQ